MVKTDRIRAELSVGPVGKSIALAIALLEDFNGYDRNRILRTVLLYFGWRQDANSQWWHE